MKRAIIIGATSGIGREVAITLARQGVVVGVAGRRVERLCELQQMFGPERIHIAELDVTAEDSTTNLNKLISAVGAPDYRCLQRAFCRGKARWRSSDYTIDDKVRSCSECANSSFAF